MITQGRYSDFYEEVCFLAKGGTCEAFKVQKDNILYCAKIMKIDWEDQKVVQSLENEIKVLNQISQFSHDNVVKFFEYFQENDKAIFILEFCQHKTLDDLIQSQYQSKSFLEENQIMDIFVQLCLGLKFLHQLNVIHRDLKPENIFLSFKGIIKIGDFGISRVFSTQYNFAKSLVGTLPYVCPEIFEEKPQTQKSDIWGLGCILHEMCTLQKTFYDPLNLRPVNFKNLILNTTQSQVNEKYSENLQNLINCLLEKDSNQRPDIDEVLQMDYVNQHLIRYTKESEQINDLFQHLITNIGIQMVEIMDIDDFYTSQLNEAVKRIIIDLAMPKQGLNLDQFYVNSDDSSESVLGLLKIVTHGSSDRQNLRQQISIGIPAERFLDKGYNMNTLKFSIETIYQDQQYNEKQVDENFQNLLQITQDKIQNHIFQDTELGKEMALSLIFYFQMRDRFIQNEENGFLLQKDICTEQVDNLQKHVDELFWWLHKSMTYLQPFKGMCYRTINFDEKEMELLNYFEKGKVFQYINFMTAKIQSQASEYQLKSSILLQIYGQTGKIVNLFNESTQESEKDIVIFGMGCEFLVCDKQFNASNNQWVVSLREIKTGFSENVVLWIDSQENFLKKNYELIDGIQNRYPQKNLTFITKSSFQLALDYIDSQFFYLSTHVCKSFKIISNDFQDENVDHLYGVSDFFKELKQRDNMNKIKSMIFCNNTRKVFNDLKMKGLNEQDIPRISYRPNDLVFFLLN